MNRPDRLARRLDGKPDRLDAEQIACAVLGQTSTANPEAQVWVSQPLKVASPTAGNAVRGTTQDQARAVFNRRRDSRNACHCVPAEDDYDRTLTAWVTVG